MTEGTIKKSILAASTLLLGLGQVSAHRPGGSQRSGIIEQCQFPGVDGLFITNEKYHYSNASLACESYGGSLADITNQNYLLGADMVLTCIGPNNKAWIGSWDYKDNNANPANGVYDCLSLTVGNIGPGGGVDKTCTGIIPVLCQDHPSVVQHNPFYSEPAWSYSQGPIPTVAPVQREIDAEDEETYPVLYPNFNGGIYRPVSPFEGDQEDQGNPVFYPGPGGVWGNPNPVRHNPQYKNPVGYIREGPKGGFPGGIYPGGLGYGSNGYPYRYPTQYRGDEDCETVTVDGVVTTITHDSTSSATVVI